MEDEKAKNSSALALCKLTPEEVVLLASAISVALAKNRTLKEIETLINISNLVNDNLTGILTQRIIRKNSQEVNLELRTPI